MHAVNRVNGGPFIRAPFYNTAYLWKYISAGSSSFFWIADHQLSRDHASFFQQRLIEKSVYINERMWKRGCPSPVGILIIFWISKWSDGRHAIDIVRRRIAAGSQQADLVRHHLEDLDCWRQGFNRAITAVKRKRSTTKNIFGLSINTQPFLIVRAKEAKLLHRPILRDGWQRIY